MNRKNFQAALRDGWTELGSPSLEDAGTVHSAGLAHELELDLLSLEHQMQKLDTLTQLHNVLRYVPKASMESLALVDLALSAAGEPNAVPSLESYEGQALSTEGLGERIRQVALNIRQFISTIINKIKGFFGALGTDAQQLQFRLNMSRDVHKELAGRFPRKAQVALGQTAIMLAMREGVPHDSRLLLTYGDNIVNQLKTLRVTYVPTVRQVGGSLAACFHDQSLKDGNVEVWLSKLTAAAQPLSFGNLQRLITPLQRMVDNRYTVDSAFMAPPILGGRALVLLNGAVDHSGEDVLSRALAARHTKFVFVRPYQAKQVDTATATMPTLPHNMIGAVQDLAQRLIDEVESSRSDGLRSGLEAMDRELARLANAAPEDVKGIDAIQVGLGFGTSFSQWCTAPYLQMISHSLSVTNALISATNKHMAAYR